MPAEIYRQTEKGSDEKVYNRNDRKRFAPISDKVPHMIHGGDYNPDQWLHDEHVLEEDEGRRSFQSGRHQQRISLHFRMVGD